jgi:hypothetical protein
MSYVDVGKNSTSIHLYSEDMVPDSLVLIHGYPLAVHQREDRSLCYSRLDVA